MKAVVNECLGKLRDDFKTTHGGLDCGIWSADGKVELRFAYTALNENIEQSSVFSIPAAAAQNDNEREQHIRAAFDYFRNLLERSAQVH